MVTQERLKELFSYDADTGYLTNLVNRGPAKQGDRAGGLHISSGYLRVRVDSKLYREHRLIWLLVHGSFPKDQIDHINGVRNDNRLCNLREATKQQNAYNRCVPADNTSGFKGVTCRKSVGDYRARIGVNGEMKHIGYYTTPEEANEAYCKASANYHKEFGRTQ